MNKDMVGNIRPIIGVNGEAQSGKDTVANMISYIIRNNRFRADYRTWSIKWDKPGMNKVDSSITHFGDFPKDICSKVFNIPRDFFDDIEYKERKYYLMDLGVFVDINRIREDYIIANHSILATSPLAALLMTYDNKVAITLRTMMQYVGTEIGRNRISENCWVTATINTAIDARSKHGYCVIPDVRFANESDVIRRQNNGYVIKVVRDIAKDNKSRNPNHVNEVFTNVEYDFLIENNGNKFQLFHKVLNLVNDKIFSTSLRGNNKD